MTEESTLTATVQAGSGYTPGSPCSASTRIVVTNPAVTAWIEETAYTFAEDTTVAVILRTATGVPSPNQSIYLSFSTLQIPGQAELNVDYGTLALTLEFRPSDFRWDGTQFTARNEVTLAIVDDALYEPDETLRLHLQWDAGTQGAVALSDPDGAACPPDRNGVPSCAATVTITDNDAPVFPPTVVSVAVKSAPQSGDTYGWGETIVFTLTLSEKVRVTGQPQPTLAFDLGGSIREARYAGMTDTDVDSDPRPRPRPEGVKVHFHYTVQPGDRDIDGIQVGELASAMELGGARIRSAADGVDADLAHAALGRLTLRENTRGRYGLKLNTRPTHTVWVMEIASDGDPDLHVLPTANATMAITPDEWETPFYMELRAAIDDDEEIGERVFVNRSSSQDPAYHDLILPDVVVVEDERGDDAGALSVADAEATEGVDTTLEFVVKLDRTPSRDWEVTVDYRTQDGTATAGSDYTLTSGTLTFAPGEDEKTVSVPIADDTVEDSGETFTLVLNNASVAGFASFGQGAVGTIRNAEMAATGTPTISGTAQAGETLTADTSGIADDDGLESVSFSYQWLADDTAIQGGNQIDLHPDRSRRGQDCQGAGELHRRYGPRGDVDQRADGSGRSKAELSCHRRSHDQRHGPGG